MYCALLQYIMYCALFQCIMYCALLLCIVHCYNALLYYVMWLCLIQAVIYNMYVYVLAIQLQLTSTITGQPGIQISGIDPSMLSQPLPLHIDNNLLAQLQQSGNLNITFNAAGVVTGQTVTLADPNLLQVRFSRELLGTTWH